MQVVRCPECGNRLDAGWCHMCMKRIPIVAQKKEDSWRERKYENDVDHKCISFEQPQQKARTHTTAAGLERPGFDMGKPPINMGKTTVWPSAKKSTAKQPKKQATVIAIVLAVISLVSTVFEGIDTIFDDPVVLEPEHEIVVNEDDWADYVEEPGIIDPTVIYDDGDIRVTVDSMGQYYGESALAVTIQNDRQQNVTVSSEMLCVNGYMLSTSGLFAQVGAQETVQDYLCLDGEELEDAGIAQIGTMAFELYMYDTDDYTSIAESGLVTLETAIAQDIVQTVDDSGETLYDDNGVRVVLKSVDNRYDDCYTMTLYLENTTEETVTFSDNGIFLNGEETDGMLWNILPPNTRRVDRIYSYDLEQWGITDLSQIQDVAMELRIEFMEDMDQWIARETVNEKIWVELS